MTWQRWLSEVSLEELGSMVDSPHFTRLVFSVGFLIGLIISITTSSSIAIGF